MTTTVYSVSEARRKFKDVLDAAVEGRPVTVTRDHRQVAAVDADRLTSFLTRLIPANARLVAEGGGWSIMLPGLPIAADGATLEEAVDEMVDALRDYAKAWTDGLRLAPNHTENWGLVQLIELSPDEELKGWLRRT
ncbi:MAG: type II toxin-antitoxin system prevent-host-death family antitoxin [Microlunatus sp.]|nr:type II toxin-antitoxin system prevent-host-death family antitoxin [Microlunatus sp.]